MENKYYLNRITGEVIDQKAQSLTEYRRRTENWAKVLVVVSKKVFSMLRRDYELKCRIGDIIDKLVWDKRNSKGSAVKARDKIYSLIKGEK